MNHVEEHQAQREGEGDGPGDAEGDGEGMGVGVGAGVGEGAQEKGPEAAHDAVRRLQQQLQVGAATWAREKSALAASMRTLREEKDALLRGDGARQDDTVAVPRAKMQAAEQRYQSMTDELAQKTRECAQLQARLGEATLGDAARPYAIDEADVVARWRELHDKIRDLSLARFGLPIAPERKKVLTKQDKADLASLSPHWQTYISTDGLVSYLFRALIWRSLYVRLFHRPAVVWGTPVQDAFSTLHTIFRNAPHIEDHARVGWRVHTASMLDQACPKSVDALDAVSAEIYAVVTRFASDGDSRDMRARMREIVDLSAQLAIVFARSHFLPLMSNQPGSNLTNGFDLNDTMNVKGRCGTRTVVDLMVTPSLLKKDLDFSVVVKADVVC